MIPEFLRLLRKEEPELQQQKQVVTVPVVQETLYIKPDRPKQPLRPVEAGKPTPREVFRQQ